MRTNWMIFAFAAVAPAFLTGCPEGMCLLQVCTNGKCSCPVNTCVEGADFDVSKNQCVCDEGRFGINGQCLEQAAADAYCGKGAKWEGTGCKRIQCSGGQEFDEASGACKDVKAVASNLGLEVKEGEKLSCPAGQKLVVDGDTAACVPVAETCGPDEIFEGNACKKKQQCAAGQMWDAAANTCVKYAEGGSDGAVVQVGEWMRTNFGADGGMGMPTFCSQFARKPMSFGVTPGNSAMVVIGVNLSFPGNDVATSSVATSPSFQGVSIAVPARGAQEVQTAAVNTLATLQRGGGKAGEASGKVTVKCPVVNAAPPIVVPASSGV
ncbi:MAG: hypothetical protein HY908_12400 [Myxococcales bacterium]|nr:hypothetical protein [Myxococcales bacterium]